MTEEIAQILRNAIKMGMQNHFHAIVSDGLKLL